MAKEKSQVVIPEADIKAITLSIKGVEGSTLIMNKFSKDAGQKIKDTQLNKPKKKCPKDPVKVFEGSQYRASNGKLGIPSIAIKAAMVRAAKIAGENMTDMRTGFHVVGDIIPFTKHSKEIMREDFLSLPAGGRDWKIRTEIEDWELKSTITFNNNFISAEQLANLLSLAGFHCGLLDNRPNSPKSSGNHGLFEMSNGNGNGKKK